MIRTLFTILMAALLLFVINHIYQPISRINLYFSQFENAQTIYKDDYLFRDLNKNQQLDIYEDARVSIELRVNDVLSQMTIEEKVGLMFHPPFTVNPGIGMRIYEILIRGNQFTESHIIKKNINHFNLYGNPDPVKLAKRINQLQNYAARSRLGIPLTISSDPIHEVERGGGIASFSVQGFSKWPSQLGLAATRDEELVKKFADIARQEYLAVGIRTALHPMADLATDPRWARNFGTFGSDSKLSTSLTLAYMDGFQGENINSQSVLTMVKHFPGGGPQENGLDAHLMSGQNQVYPGKMFDYHLEPFIEAINNNLKVIMPYYGIAVDQSNENIAIGFNRYLLNHLLREKLNYDGVICSDWGIITGRHWGVTNLTIPERYIKAINAGIDQFGGEMHPEIVVQLVRENKIDESRIDRSARRILKNKFELGLFDDPFVDIESVDKLINTQITQKLALDAQRKSVVMLKNSNLLPLTEETKIYVDGMEFKDSDINKVNTIEEADVILMYLHTVFNGNQEPGTDRLFDRFLSNLFPNTDLRFNNQVIKRASEYSQVKPLILVVDLNRPAILSELNDLSDALIGTFGVNDEVIHEIINGKTNPSGKLPFELPSSMSEVEEQFEDVPDDTANPLYKYGYGLSFTD
ncbi:glycoside hydrolase family 3 C-terminal domain-containing protein [Gammaproteobacteria bacterium]|nr:glycoside hydrolase family 3 C-terminal domain-containing protein [Gammaproteobacteria bacterium]